jgi:hypothetical protein
MSDLVFLGIEQGTIRRKLGSGPLIARKYRAGRRLLIELCKARRVDVLDVRRANSAKHIVAVRREFCQLSQEHGLGSVIAGHVIGLDASTVQYHRSPNIRARKRARDGRRNSAD